MDAHPARRHRSWRLPITVLALAAIASCDACSDDPTEPPQAPVAVVGPDMTVHVGDLVQLNGSSSYDPDGAAGTLTYAWSLISRPAGSAAVIANPSAASTSFTVDVTGTYVAQLIVNDGQLSSSPVHCNITAENRVPVADAGPDMTMNVGQEVHLNGAGSSDPDGQNLTYNWSFVSRPAGSAATLSNPMLVNPTFTVDTKGSFVVQLIVSDGTATSSPDVCTITVPNRPPAANAGPDQNVDKGDVVQLNGSGSSDPDNDPLTYSWVFFGRPAGSSASLSSPSAMNPTFTADAAGDYVLDLTVSDGDVSSVPDRVTVNAVGGPRPGQYAGTTSEGKPITFVVAANRESIESGISVTFLFSCTFCSGSVKVTRNASISMSAGQFSYSSGSSALPGHFAVGGEATSETTFTGTAAFRADPPAIMGCGLCSLASVTWTASWVGPAPVLGAEAALELGDDVLRVERDEYCADMTFKVRKRQE